MPTFLPFSRAVKTTNAHWVVYALFVAVVNCGPTRTPRVTPGPLTGPLPSATASNASESPATPELSVPPEASELATSNPSADSVSVEPQVLVDLPYPVDARPRAQDPARAAAEDEELARWNLGGSSDPASVSNQASYHPGTRVVVDTRPAKRRAGAPPLPAPRGLTYQRVQAQARSRGYWPFRLCFERGQRDKKSSGGETRVAFSIGTRGKVTAVRLLESELKNASVAGCLVRETQKLEFSPAPASKLHLVATIQVYPGDAELPAGPDPAAVLAQPRGEFDPEAARARVLAKQVELAACFAEARRVDPAVWGRLALSVILEIDGSVHRVTEVESHFPNATATRCVQALLASVTFPSVNGKPFSFVVPLRLSPNPLPPKETGPDESPSPSPLQMDAGRD